MECIDAMFTIAFVVTCLTMSMAPGPAFSVMVQRALSRGRATGMMVILGNTTGLVAWGVASGSD